MANIIKDPKDIVDPPRLTPKQFLEEFAVELIQTTDVRTVINGYAKHLDAREEAIRIESSNYRPKKSLLAGMLLAGIAFSMLGGSVSAAPITTQDVVSQVNDVRTLHDLSPLVINPKLEQSAAARAKDLCAQSYFGHVSPTGKHTADFISEAGYKYQIAGENLAQGYDTTDHAVAAWVASPTHFKNIVKPVYKETGVALYDCPNYQGHDVSTIIVQHFGDPARVKAPAEAATSKANATKSPYAAATYILAILVVVGFVIGAITKRANINKK